MGAQKRPVEPAWADTEPPRDRPRIGPQGISRGRVYVGQRAGRGL